MRYILIGLILLSLPGCKGRDSKAEKREVQNTSPISSSNDEESLLDSVQKQTINYFWDGANKDSGLAPERIHLDDIYPSDDKNTVTNGNSCRYRTGFYC